MPGQSRWAQEGDGLEGSDLAICCRGLTRWFGFSTQPIRAVDGVDLAVPRGEIVALVGPDGAGKTTLLRLLTAVLPPSSGSATVAGQELVTQAEGVKARIGYMPQRCGLYGDLSIDENLEFYGALYEVPSTEITERATRLLERFRLVGFRQRLARELSGGMKQKAALACTLLHAPQLLFLDEPTAGVDPVSRRQFWRTLYELNRSGLTVLVSTPYLDEAARASQIAFMHQGRIPLCDTYTNLVARASGQAEPPLLTQPLAEGATLEDVFVAWLQERL
jgi:ABC-2 type transport system ATP-binding protein